MSKTAGTILSTATMCIYLVAAAGPAVGADSDHLKCFKIRDPAPHGRYTVSFETHDNAWPGFAIEAGCIVKTPAKLMCIDAIKLTVDPAPPGAPEGKRVGQSFVCYKMKCSPDHPSIPVNDQFGGVRTVQQAGRASLVCAPNATFSPSGAFLD
jgi:hypothetical protein